MPIHRDQRHRYPVDWKAISARVREAAGHRCQRCDVRDRAWGFRQLGEFFEIEQMEGRPHPPFRLDVDGVPRRIIEIVLTVAHLDHQPENNTDNNLQALCQRCHLNHDRPHHRRTQLARRRAAMQTPELSLPAGAPP